MSVAERLAAHLRADGAHVQSVTPLAGGACQDLFRVELERDGTVERWVLRSDALVSLPGSIPREQEYEVVRAAHAAGVPTPQARWFGRDLVRDGAGAYLLGWCEGIALGGKVVRDPRLAAARDALPEQLASALAAIHATPPPAGLDGPGGRRTGEWALERMRGTLDRLPQPRVELELVYRWLADNLPPDARQVLCHGDFRVGNFLVTPEGLSAVLDWEFAHVGSAAEDIAWLCVRDWRFGAVDKPVGGLCDRQRFYQAYAQASGQQVDPAAVHFWEVYGNLSWAAGALWQTERYLGGDMDFELLAIGRRSAEMSFEALRLIERGVMA